MVDQAPAGITFKNEHGLDCVLVAMHIEDAHEFEAHIADESDLRAAGFVKLSGSDGPTCDHKFSRRTRDTWECGGCGAFLKEGSLEWVLPAWRKDYNEGFAAGLALGEQKQAARVRELERLGDEGFVFKRADLEKLLKGSEEARLAAESELAAMKEKLAEVERELNEARSYLPLDEPDGPLPRRVLTLVEDLRYVRSELASARRVVEAARPIRRWLAKEVERRTGGGDDCHELLALLEPLERAIASAGMDADRAEVPRAEAGKPRRICYEHGPYERRCPACATEEPQPSAPKRQPEVERDDGSEQE